MQTARQQATHNDCMTSKSNIQWISDLPILGLINNILVLMTSPLQGVHVLLFSVY